MQKGWWCLGLGIVVSALSACSSDSAATSVPQPATPCVLTPANVPNNAMGSLGIRIFQVGDEVRIVLPSDNIFVAGSGEILQPAYPGLDYLAKYLRKFGQISMQVTAYTDDLALPAQNKWLAEQQARNLATYLWTRGLDHCCLISTGIGEDETQTVASNRSIAGSTANRRIEITFRVNPPSHTLL